MPETIEMRYHFFKTNSESPTFYGRIPCPIMTVAPPLTYVSRFPCNWQLLAPPAFPGQRTPSYQIRTSQSHSKFCNDLCIHTRGSPRRHRSRAPVVAHVAIVGTVPSSLQNALLAPGFKPSDISLQIAKSQHEHYCSALSTTSVTSLIQLPENSWYPDSIFVEDPVVVISEKTAFMARAGHPSREGEGDAVEYHLEKLGVRISKHPEVRLDGGDVMKMNEFILVGITERTERAAIPALQRVVNEDFHSNPCYETCPLVIGVPVGEGLHLKSLVTWVGAFGGDCDGFIVAPDTKSGRELISRILAITPRDWDIVWIDESEGYAANVLYIPPPPSDALRGSGHVLVQEKCPKAVNAIRTSLEKYDSDFAKTVVIPVDISEFGKINGSLTCMSIII